ncbi:MAG TPA: hypothetical protein VFZ99_00075 [Terriglobales bacterium]
MASKFPNWDTAVSLAYAAEQLVLAAQLLTSDIMPLSKAVATVYERHVPAILEHKKWLPFDVAQQLADAFSDYRSARHHILNHRIVQHLRSRLLKVLTIVNSYLLDYNPEALAA